MYSVEINGIAVEELFANVESVLNKYPKAETIKFVKKIAQSEMLETAVQEDNKEPVEEN